MYSLSKGYKSMGKELLRPKSMWWRDLRSNVSRWQLNPGETGTRAT